VRGDLMHLSADWDRTSIIATTRRCHVAAEDNLLTAYVMFRRRWNCECRNESTSIQLNNWVGTGTTRLVCALYVFHARDHSTWTVLDTQLFVLAPACTRKL